MIGINSSGVGSGAHKTQKRSDSARASENEFSPRRYDKFSYCVRRSSPTGRGPQTPPHSPSNNGKRETPQTTSATGNTAEHSPLNKKSATRYTKESSPLFPAREEGEEEKEGVTPFQLYYRSLRPLTKRDDQLFAVAEDGSISSPFVSPLKYTPGPLSSLLSVPPPMTIREGGGLRQRAQSSSPRRNPSAHRADQAPQQQSSSASNSELRHRTWAAFLSDASADFTEGELLALSWDVLQALLKHYRFDSPIAVAHVQLTWMAKNGIAASRSTSVVPPPPPPPPERDVSGGSPTACSAMSSPQRSTTRGTILNDFRRYDHVAPKVSSTRKR